MWRRIQSSVRRKKQPNPKDARYSYRFLAAQTLKIASMNGLGELDRLESELEEEINYDSRAPPSETIQKIRRKVEHVLHSKPVLLAVVVLNVIDCLLVLGELTFDFNHVGNLIKKTEEGQNHFIHALEKHYPDDIHGYSHTTIGKVYDKLLDAEILWHGFNHSLMCAVNLSTDANHTALSRHKRASGGGGGHEGGHSIEEELGHGFHLASVAILSLLVLLTALKVAATVPRFFKSKMQEELAKLFREEFDQDSFTGASEINRDCTQVFDAVVIIVSFIIDLVFIEGLMSIAISNLVIILTFLLPWRIIRILNSLIVAVLDKQRFQMKLLYKQKKKIDKQYQEAHEKNKHLLKQMDTLKGFCSEKGINAAEMKHVLGTAHQSKSGKMRALGKLALGPAESLSPRVLSKHISSSSGTPNGQPISFIEARKHSASTPNLPVIDETHVNVDDAVSKI